MEIVVFMKKCRIDRKRKKVGNEFPCLLGHPAKKIAESFALLKDTGGKSPIAQLT